MFKKIISYIAAGFAIAGAFIFGSYINRQRVSRDSDSIDRIRDGVEESGKINSQLKERIDTSGKLTADIGKDNSTASAGIRTAKEILERAKKRTDEGKNL